VVTQEKVDTQVILGLLLVTAVLSGFQWVIQSTSGFFRLFWSKADILVILVIVGIQELSALFRLLRSRNIQDFLVIQVKSGYSGYSAPSLMPLSTQNNILIITFVSYR
jgi:hypothetical protein